MTPAEHTSHAHTFDIMQTHTAENINVLVQAVDMNSCTAHRVRNSPASACLQARLTAQALNADEHAHTCMALCMEFIWLGGIELNTLRASWKQSCPPSDIRESAIDSD